MFKIHFAVIKCAVYFFPVKCCFTWRTSLIELPCRIQVQHWCQHRSQSPTQNAGDAVFWSSIQSLSNPWENSYIHCSLSLLPPRHRTTLYGLGPSPRKCYTEVLSSPLSTTVDSRPCSNHKMTVDICPANLNPIDLTVTSRVYCMSEIVYVLWVGNS